MTAHQMGELGDRIYAAFDLVARTGAKSCTFRWCDEEEPVIYFMIAEYERDADGKVVYAGQDGGVKSEYVMTADIGLNRACDLLLDRLVDGGRCTHCHKPTAVEHHDLGPQPLSSALCWYQYDPELKTYRRSCE